MTTTTESSIRLLTSIPGPQSRELLQRRENSVPRGIGSTLPVYVKRASGVIIEDIDGNQFLDFAGGIGCQNAGHSAPEVVAAIHQQVDQFLHTCFMVTPYEDYIELAEELNARTPGSFAKKTFFVSTGAEAVENAIKIARNYTRKQAVIAFEDAFHGRTQLAVSLTSKTHPYKAGYGPFAPEIYRLPYAYCYRCAYHLKYPECGIECARRLDSLFKRHVESEAVAAVIFEPVLGEGGFVAPPPEWFGVVSKICREHSILVIADEIQTGFCRTGPLFASEHFGLEPDILISAKTIAGGLPLASVTGRAEIMDAPVPGALGGTFGGNPVSCAAALALLKTIEQEKLAERAVGIGDLFEKFTSDWTKRFGLIGDIRGLGAMRAIEFVKDRATKEPATSEVKQILAECHKRGLLVISAGTYGNVIRILVPLIVTDAQFEEGLRVLEESIASIH